MEHQDTIPFPDELKHLDYTLKIIDTALTKAGEDVLRLDQEYRDAKRYMAEYRNEMDRHEKLIFDWRAPVSGIFYDYETGRAGFEAPVGRIEGELTRKRQFKIQNGTMEYAIESSANVQDEILQKELAHTSDEKMKSMISTIQREPNVIIRNESRYPYDTGGCRFGKNIHCTSQNCIFAVSPQKSDYRRGCNDSI